MASLHMISWELAELSRLLRQYKDLYPIDNLSANELPDEVETQLTNRSSSPYSARNPRDAGRHPKIKDTERQLFLN